MDGDSATTIPGAQAEALAQHILGRPPSGAAKAALAVANAP